MMSRSSVFTVFALAFGLLAGPYLHPTQSDHMSEMSHDHSETVSVANTDGAPNFDFMLTKGAVSGWNLHIQTASFLFTPQAVNQANVPAQGHAHIYVNGVKLSRIYSSWFHIASLPEGANITVTLNTNNHSPLVVGDVLLSVTKPVLES
ncbi:MAG: hypothetical protein ACI861_000917 [Paracoccaceae bacterium]|jgi:hypothetical protein